VPSNPYLSSPRWAVVEQIADMVLRRYRGQIHAIGVHGSLAHGDDADGADVDVVVITFRPGTGPRPTSRRVNDVIVDLGVISAEEYLEYARTLSTSWPLAADQYLTTKPVYDPDGWHGRLRDAHLGRLAEASGREFVALAREAWCTAEATFAKALRLAEWHDTDGALLTLCEARLSSAMVEGLLTRTYFRHGAEAVRRTGLGEADMSEVGRRLRAQAEELAKRGCPVDGTVADLLA